MFNEKELILSYVLGVFSVILMMYIRSYCSDSFSSPESSEVYESQGVMKHGEFVSNADGKSLYLKIIRKTKGRDMLLSSDLSKFISLVNAYNKHNGELYKTTISETDSWELGDWDTFFWNKSGHIYDENTKFEAVIYAPHLPGKLYGQRFLNLRSSKTRKGELGGLLMLWDENGETVKGNLFEKIPMPTQPVVSVAELNLEKCLNDKINLESKLRKITTELNKTKSDWRVLKESRNASPPNTKCTIL